ncbi:unnamed protein product [Trichobilharzia regenti]|nr:unnamed protein product [Trichobilharzia regenti]
MRSLGVNAGSWLALRYNDISPLENHHCVTAFEIISNPTTNITSGLTQTESRHFRRSVIRCILSTDMAIHTECISQFQYLRQQVIAVSHKLTSPSMENNATSNTTSVNHVATTADDDEVEVEDDDGNNQPCRPNQCYSVFPSPQLASVTPLLHAHVSPPISQPPPPTSISITHLLSNSHGLTSHDYNEVDQCDNDNDDDGEDKESRQRRQQQQQYSTVKDDSLLRSSLFSLIHEQPEYLLRFLMILLKVCDVSNETRSPSVADAWSDCLFNEFFMQIHSFSSTDR